MALIIEIKDNYSVGLYFGDVSLSMFDSVKALLWAHFLCLNA